MPESHLRGWRWGMQGPVCGELWVKPSSMVLRCLQPIWRRVQKWCHQIVVAPLLTSVFSNWTYRHSLFDALRRMARWPTDPSMSVLCTLPAGQDETGRRIPPCPPGTAPILSWYLLTALHHCCQSDSSGSTPEWVTEQGSKKWLPARTLHKFSQ